MIGSPEAIPEHEDRSIVAPVTPISVSSDFRICCLLGRGERGVVRGVAEPMGGATHTIGLLWLCSGSEDRLVMASAQAEREKNPFPRGERKPSTRPSPRRTLYLRVSLSRWQRGGGLDIHCRSPLRMPTGQTSAASEACHTAVCMLGQTVPLECVEHTKKTDSPPPSVSSTMQLSRVAYSWGAAV